MNFNGGIGTDRLPEGLLTQMEPGSTDSRPQSVASSYAHYNNEEYAVELWEDLRDILQAQEDDFIEQDERTGLLFDTLATPVIKKPGTHTSPTISFQHLPVVPSLVSGSPPFPSFSPLNSPLHPVSTIWPIVPDLKGEYQPHLSPPRPPVLLPSQVTSAAGQSVSNRPARESPSGQFFASPDQIDALGMPMTWVHGQVISTLGDTFCNGSRSESRHKCYKVLPTDLFDLWNSFMGGHTALWATLSFHFK
jgi:hypothetical protein